MLPNFKTKKRAKQAQRLIICGLVFSLAYVSGEKNQLHGTWYITKTLRNRGKDKRSRTLQESNSHVFWDSQVNTNMYGTVRSLSWDRSIAITSHQIRSDAKDLKELFEMRRDQFIKS